MSITSRGFRSAAKARSDQEPPHLAHEIQGAADADHPLLTRELFRCSRACRAEGIALGRHAEVPGALRQHFGIDSGHPGRGRPGRHHRPGERREGTKHLGGIFGPSESKEKDGAHVREKAAQGAAPAPRPLQGCGRRREGSLDAPGKARASPASGRSRAPARTWLSLTANPASASASTSVTATAAFCT